MPTRRNILCSIFATFSVIAFGILYLRSLCVCHDPLLNLSNNYGYNQHEENEGMGSGPIIGIDLDALYLHVGITQNGNFTLIPGKYGGTKTATYISYLDDGTAIVGFQAKMLAELLPERTIYDFWPLLGRNFSHPEVQAHIQAVDYSITNTSNLPTIFIPSTTSHESLTISPSAILSTLLSHLKTNAEAHLNETVTRAVITVPITFDDSQRQAVRTAAEQIQLKVVRIINHPMAVGMGFELDVGSNEERIVMFRHSNPFSQIISLVSIDQGVFEVLGVECSYGSSIGEEKMIENVLKKAKVSKKELYQYVRTISMNHHTKSAEHFPTPFLLGGYTIFESEQAAVKGAALQASYLFNYKEELCGLSFDDVTHAPLGISLYNSSVAKIIHADTLIPTRHSITVTTISEEAQESIKFDILEGGYPLAQYNTVLGTVELKNLAGKRGSGRHTVTFEVDMNYLLTVTVEEIGSRNGAEKVFVRQVSVERADGLEVEEEGTGGLEIQSMRSGKQEKNGLAIVCDGANAWFDTTYGVCRSD